MQRESKTHTGLSLVVNLVLELNFGRECDYSSIISRHNS